MASSDSKVQAEFREWWAAKGRLLDVPGAMAERIMFAEKVWDAALEADLRELQQRIKQAFPAMSDDICKMISGEKEP